MLATAQKSPEAFRTISEVAVELELPQHVLRFWETRFGAVKPLKRGGGRRYYRPEDVDLLKGIRSLLYSDGLTIKGVQKVLKDRGIRYVAELGRGGASLTGPLRIVAEREPEPEEPAPTRAQSHSADHHITGSERARFASLLDELQELKVRLRTARRATA
ncbi:MAG TPA: MerR family transcriptional regulator [Micropepsaceae bacterium]|nr:MerR family transcriptional regulator [Micropepsaceae bacterium]